MKVVLGVIALLALGLTAADAATLNLAGVFHPGALLQMVGTNIPCDPRTVPEPATWGLMILGFTGLGLAVRRRRVSA